MRGKRFALALAGFAVAVPAAVAQQKPIYGCGSAIGCRPSPVGNSANALDAGGNMLIGGAVSFGPGLHFRLITPLLRVPPAEPPGPKVFTFHLWDATLLPPTPEPTPAPSPTPRLLQPGTEKRGSIVPARHEGSGAGISLCSEMTGIAMKA